MKKIYFTLLSTLLPLLLMAQPVITDAITPEIGETWPITLMEVTNFETGPVGADQTWDFSDLDLSNSLDLNIRILAPDEVVNGPNFPTADFVWYLEGFEVYNYYSVNEDSLSLVGGASIQTGTIDFLTEFIDPEDGLQFPIEYEDSYTYYSVFEQTVFGTPLGLQVRNGIVVADGYGTLITPNGTYDNILRLIITETSFGITSTQYAWMDVNNFVPVFLYETSDDPDTPPSLYFSEPNTSTTSTDDLSESFGDWDARYNRAEGAVIIDFSNIEKAESVNIQAYTLDGKLIANGETDLSNPQYQLNLPNQVSQPLIVITLQTAGGQSSKKIPVWR